MSDPHPKRIVIAGGGLAGVSAIETLRSQGYEGQIRLISAEAELPYDRPPLSKAYLAGEVVAADLLLHDEAWYRDQKVDLQLGASVTVIDAGRRQLFVRLAGEDVTNGRSTVRSGIDYDRLLIAVGARARTYDAIPAEGLPRLRYLRTRHDAADIGKAVARGSHVVLIGGGVIGLETAATLRQMGCEVTVLEAAERVMARLFPKELSRMLSELHADRGVKIELCADIERLKETPAGWVVDLRGRPSLNADFLIVGIGVVPNQEIAAAAGLAIRLQGVSVDEHARTTAPGIYAAGDVASFPLSDGRFVRWENWTHARQHAAVAVRHMLGREGFGYFAIPWVWSDQFEFNIQITGSAVADRVVLRGSMESGRLTAFHLDQGRIVGATTFNDSRHKAAIRSLIESSACLSVAELTDPSVDLKSVAAEWAGRASAGSRPGMADPR